MPGKRKPWDTPRRTYARTLDRACRILGGPAQFAMHAGVAQSALGMWLEGREEPPEQVFLAALEVILLDADTGPTRQA